MDGQDDSYVPQKALFAGVIIKVLFAVRTRNLIDW